MHGQQNIKKIINSELNLFIVNLQYVFNQHNKHNQQCLHNNQHNKHNQQCLHNNQHNKHNQQCLHNKIIPKYAQLKVPNTFLASQNTAQKARIFLMFVVLTEHIL